MLEGWAPLFTTLELVPDTAGRFEVTLDGELIFSKAQLGRHAREGEVADLVRERIGEEVMEG